MAAHTGQDSPSPSAPHLPPPTHLSHPRVFFPEKEESLEEWRERREKTGTVLYRKHFWEVFRPKKPADLLESHSGVAAGEAPASGHAVVPRANGSSAAAEPVSTQT
jgi:hypothetical protein